MSSDLHRCYLLSTVRADWFEAKERCWMRNSYLVKIETREENDFLLRAVAKRKYRKVLICDVQFYECMRLFVSKADLHCTGSIAALGERVFAISHLSDCKTFYA